MKPRFFVMAIAMLAPVAALANESEIVVKGQRPTNADANPPSPATKATITAESIATTTNALSVEDTLKYLPSLVIRKRHIGDTFAPIATRTSGLGASARSLIYADGALLSALIANNNGNGSPRWSLVSPEEIDHIDVLYGPFSAAYGGNSIGTTVNITTRMPDRLAARASVIANVQQFNLYGTQRSLPSWQFSGAIGDRFGPLAVNLGFTRINANSQPLSIITASSQPSGTSGGYAAVNRLGAAIRVLGAGGLEQHMQDSAKLRLTYDLNPGLRLAYNLGLWRDDTSSTVQSYLLNTAGVISFASANNGSTAGFNSAVYARDALHISHAISLTGQVPKLDWQVVGTLYRYARDWQNNPTTTLPAAFTGGAGTVQRQDGTGWTTLDARGTWQVAGGHSLSFGGHLDAETLNAQVLVLSNWRDNSSATGVVNSASHGHTRTWALWAQDAFKLAPDLTLTLGGRQEWWRADGGRNSSLIGGAFVTLAQPARRFSGFSPKATVEWKPAQDWSLRLSLGQAFRTPTVGELYQTTTVGTQLANPNPGLLPERARSGELALERRNQNGFVRLSLFNEVIANALISQLNSTTNTTYVQNVDRTRARGVELALEQHDIVPHFDLSASVTYADAITSKDSVFPAAVGKVLPSVPHWKANAVLTWRPSHRFSLTSALRMVSRNYATLDNSDVVGNTYQGFYKYVIVDMRARVRINDRFDFAIGVDNLNNAKYFLFHPFPQRSFTAQVHWRM